MQSRVVIQEGSGRRRRWTKEEKGRIVGKRSFFCAYQEGAIAV
jgi:hypothetical protein